MKREQESSYDDIIHLPHHVSAKRPQMSALGRAAQFSPFAALAGYDAAVHETARLTDRYIELDEESKAIISEKLRMLSVLPGRPEITITYFEPDEKKTGGAYCSVTGQVRRIDEVARTVELADRTVIHMDRIYNMEGDFFKGFEEL